MKESTLPSSRAKLDSIPQQITCVQDYSELAKQYIDHPSYEYISAGSGNEQTLQANHTAFNHIAIYNRLLVDCSQGNTKGQILGTPIAHPILLAPVAFQKLVHPQGELETVRAAEATQTPMIVSTLSSTSLEQIAQQAPAQLWFQLYFQPQRAHTLDLVRRAEAAGYRTLVVTLDASIQASNRRAQKAGFVFPEQVSPQNLVHYPVPVQKQLQPDSSIIFQGMMGDAPNWQDLAWLRQQTQLPILVKGVLHPQDALQLMEMGINGVVVSNHGGRALDGVPAALQALPAIREALGQSATILMDGGIQSGYHVFKALACGADAVLVGRPQLYSLGVAGALGVAHMIRLLTEELQLCMALAGCPTLDHIDQNCIFSSKPGGE